MARARNSQIDLSATPFYHVINRCVRRCYLCGEDFYSGKNYDHRRKWLLKRIKFLSTVFSIDIAAYAIMSNHYHLVIHVDTARAIKWSDDEIVSRWYQLFKGNPLVDNYKLGDKLSAAQSKAVTKIISIWRTRLYDISWFMKCLNEYIARAANKEDQCTGKFWEGRFKSQALLDDIALLSCMAYVDLNPIRAHIADSLETSDFTSIQERLVQNRSHQKFSQRKSSYSDINICQQPSTLLPLSTQYLSSEIPLIIGEYLALVDWSSRCIVKSKQGVEDNNLPDIFSKMAIELDDWLETIRNFRRQYGSFAGSKQTLLRCAHAHGHEWYKGVG